MLYDDFREGESWVVDRIRYPQDVHNRHGDDVTRLVEFSDRRIRATDCTVVGLCAFRDHMCIA